MQQVVPSRVDTHGYADDHALKKLFKSGLPENYDELETVNAIESTMINIKQWMDSCRLQMNTMKTEAILFGSAYQLSKCVTNSIQVVNDVINYSSALTYLGALLDNELKMTKHVTLKCKTAMWNLLKIAKIRKYLDKDACCTIILGLVISHLDYIHTGAKLKKK